MFEKYDVAVIGGGVAGCAAAISSARAGLKTVLLERSLTLGGLATNGLVNFFEPLCDGKGRQIIFGIAEEMLSRITAVGGDRIPEVWKTGTAEERIAASALPKSRGRYVSAFSPTLCALSLLDWAIGEGVEVIFDALLVEVETEDGSVTGLRFATQSGYEDFTANCYIDATGSAEVFFRGGFPTAEGRNALTYMAHMKDRRWRVLGPQNPWRNTEGERIAGTSSADVNRIVREGQLELYSELKAAPAEVVALPSMPQFRTIRRIVGEYTLTEKDANTRLEDSLGVGGHFDVPGKWYEIPYRSLVLPQAKNLIAAGRIISADGDAWVATRVIPIAALTGELGGLIAAASLEMKRPVSALPLEALRNLAHARGILTEI